VLCAQNQEASMTSDQSESAAQEALPAPSNPPTADDWKSFRPLITELYQTRQHTARQVVQELRQRGFLATSVYHS
jgi:hypothetical protein